MRLSQDRCVGKGPRWSGEKKKAHSQGTTANRRGSLAAKRLPKRGCPAHVLLLMRRRRRQNQHGLAPDSRQKKVTIRSNKPPRDLA